MIKRLLIICLLLFVPIDAYSTGTSPYIYGIAGQPPAEEEPPTATITGSYTTSPATLDLTTEGTTDWWHYGMTVVGTRISKSGATVMTDVSITGTPTRGTGSTVGPQISWSDGDPTASASAVQTQIYVSASGSSAGFSWTLPCAADSVNRVAKFYVRAGFGTGPYTFTATLTGATTYTESGWTGSTASNRVYTVAYSGTGNMTCTFTTDNGVVAVQAVTLSTDGDGDDDPFDPPPPLIYVRTPENGGSDTSPGDGTTGHPYATIAKALTVATSGDTVVIGDGAYATGQLTIPTGVSMTSESLDNSKVRIYPSTNLSHGTPHILLSSATVNSTGDQSISYLEFDGIDGSYRAQQMLLVQNRNDVSIHHCNIHDYSKPVASVTDEQLYPALKIVSTQIAATAAWWTYWPANAQDPGTDTNITALWPTNPVQRFLFYDNLVSDCFPIYPFNLKDSDFYNNVIDNRGTGGWAFKATCSFLQDCEFHDNEMYGDLADETGQTRWRLELWMHRGTQIYNNISNGGYSITVGKGVDIYDNIVYYDPITGSTGTNNYETGIEINSQSWIDVYENYIYNAGYGVRLGHFGTNTTAWQIPEVHVFRNAIYNCSQQYIRPESTTNSIVSNIDIYHNVMDSAGARGGGGVKMIQSGASSMSYIDMRNNIVSNIPAYAFIKQGTVSNITCDKNGIFNCANTYSGVTGTNTVITSPAYYNAGADYAGYRATGADYVDDAVALTGYNDTYGGDGPDIGAVENE